MLLRSRLARSYASYFLLSLQLTLSSTLFSIAQSPSLLEDSTRLKRNEAKSKRIQTGYVTVDNQSVTSVIPVVDSAEFNRGIIHGAEQLIDGKIAGLRIINSGEPGGASSFQIRGEGLNDAFPLVVVDGIPLNDNRLAGGRNFLSLINPADILTITLLKDAAASAIYGMRGAKGVLLITTKSGAPGKLKIRYEGSYGVSIIQRRPDFLTPSEFRKTIQIMAPQNMDELGEANTDWIDEVTEVAQNTQHTVSLSGGKHKTTYYGSINYLQNEGVLRFTHNKKLNLALKVDQRFFNDDLTVSLNLKNTFTHDSFGPNVLESAAGFDPTQSVKNSNGEYFEWDNPLATPNPVASQELTDIQGKTFRSLSSGAIRYAIPSVKGLSLKTNFAYDYGSGNYDQIIFGEAKQAYNSGGSMTSGERINTNTFVEFLTEYQRTFTKHTINAVAGYAWQNFKATEDFISGDSIKRSDGEYEPTYNIYTNSSKSESRIISFFGAIHYGFDDKYVLSVSLRSDGSSNFKDQWGLFPAVSVGWQILNENFAAAWRRSMSELKIRASYGLTGKSYRPYTLLTDSNIKWEETSSFNIGLDAGFSKGRVTTSLDFYTKDDKDLLWVISVPAGSGGSEYILANIGKVNNKGVELTLRAKVVAKSNVSWNLNFNAAYNKNKIIKLDNQSADDLKDFPGYPSGSIEGDIGQTIQILKVGEPIGTFYVYNHKRNPDGSLVVDSNGDGIQSPIEMYEDINTDGVINEEDLIRYKKSTPDVILGLTSTLHVKRWDLSFTLKGNVGNSVYNNIASANGYFQRLTETGITNNIHTSTFETNFRARQLHSNYYVQDASFLKLTNISLGHSFTKFSFGLVRAYLTAQNVFTLSKYKGMDPESDNGIDINQYPRSITFMGGIQVTFNNN